MDSGRTLPWVKVVGSRLGDREIGQVVYGTPKVVQTSCTFLYIHFA